MKKLDLQKLAKMRLAESECLLDNKFYDGAKYLLGYAVELALKWRICGVLNRSEYFPGGGRGPFKDFHIHKIEHLLILASLEQTIAVDGFWEAEISKLKALDTASHYQLAVNLTQPTAQSLIQLV